ncbi:MAG: ABC transporter ATP-binding protein [Prolixibacteraceae bacterium]|jgi:iron complex transport system ATP-binding protein|nr:ABC transporter ATP-binding protein [Prolixibacteraceae bacterium]MBT6997855.1 ABC transporter ATP-binding protein [Prolixibacteraceae bacterium]MBT7394430.1 ABC transporter ATP-binding protein [Prolixibacteraceae bacterium]
MKLETRSNIELINLTVGYEQPDGVPLEILKGMNFTAESGEMVALIGSNGIGKSTLLRSMVGFLKYFSGNIKFNGKELNEFGAKEVAQIMSFVSTDNVRVANMTVFDLVAYGRFPYTNWIGKLTNNDKNIVEEAIEKVGLSGFENRLITQISDGERQRAMIARAVSQDTSVIILDEPTAFLDVSNKYEIFHLLQILSREKGKTIVLSTHDLNIALREVDKLWIVTENNNFQGAPEDAVLNGWLNQLFKNKHVGFDLQEGEYFFKKEFKAKVKVVGEGLALTWTLRALNRMGYQIVIQAEPDFYVFVNENSWELKLKKSTQVFNSIYQLLAFLR